MQRVRKILIAMGVVAAVLAITYANRMSILQYSLGWYTDIRHPREQNHAVPWMAGPAQAEKPAGERPPNIIVILADDLGINGVTTYGGGYGAQGAATPNIDAIAQQGVRFEAGYAGSAVCTPSRAALMSGRYPWRFGVEFVPTPGAMARVAGELYSRKDQLYQVHVDKEKAAQAKDFNELGMPASEVTVAETLKARGYHTVHIGKWHLGSTPEMRPNNQGFDETLFMESGLYLPQNDPNVVNSKQDFDPIDRFLWPNMRFGVSYNGGKWFEPAKYLTDYFTDEAVATIKQNRNRPFFLYLAHWGVHTPLQASKEDYDALPGIDNHRRRVMAAMVRSVDRSVARVMQALRDEGLEDNTLVIFTSDNGAPGYIGLPEVNQPYRGWKLTLFEGGLRVPYMAKWPARIPAGSVVKQPITNIDLLPTFAAAAGARLDTDRVIDGVNLLPAMEGKGVVPERPLFWRDGEMIALRHEGWKYISAPTPKKEWLFNLKDDPTEKRNLATSEPERLARMRALVVAHNKDMVPSLWPSFIDIPVMIDKTLDQEQAPGDEYTYWAN